MVSEYSKSGGETGGVTLDLYYDRSLWSPCGSHSAVLTSGPDQRRVKVVSGSLLELGLLVRLLL